MRELPPFKDICVMLRNGNPEAWDAFLIRFNEYTNNALVAMSEAAPAEAHIMQGRAQQCRALLRIFKESILSQGKPAP